MTSAINLKDGNVYTFKVPQNSANYQVRVANTAKGLWMCIQQSYMQWKLTISPELLSQTVEKATGGKIQLSYKEFMEAISQALKRESENWSIGIMTPVQLQILRGGSASKSSNTNKIYLILSEKNKKFHFPFTFTMNDFCEKQKITEAIKSMKEQLEELRISNDKSMSSFSIMTESNLAGEQVVLENQELKKKIKIYEDALTQKRGAVEIDTILRQKNSLEIQAETKRREEAKEITRLKNVHNLMERQINDLKNQIDFINRELLILEDSMANPAKLKSHAMRVLKSYETDLRTSKKVLMKQTKEIQNVKRNIQNSKNNEKRQLAKIKQIQTEIDQAKKKANVKQISNRLHSPGSKGGSSAAGSMKAPSVASDSSDGKGPRSLGNRLYNRPGQTNNLVRQNLLKRTSDIKNDRSVSNSAGKNQLLKTTPNITPVPPRKTDYKPPARPVVSSHQIGANNNRSQNLRNTGPNRFNNTTKSNDSSSVRSASNEIKKREFSPAERERQKQAMERLTGGSKGRTNNNPPPSSRNSANKKPPLHSSSNKHINSNSKPKPDFGMGKKDNAKQILNRMKQVRAQYNNRSRNSAAKQQGIAAKVAELTKK